MSKKGENIFKRKDGRWEARYEKGRNPDGSIVYGFCYGKSYREAREKVNGFKADVLLGKTVNVKGLKGRFGQYCDEWIAVKRTFIKQSTYVKYKAVLNSHIMPALGHYRLSAITTSACSRFTEYLIDSGLSPKTVRDILTVFSAVVKYVRKRVAGFAQNMEIVFPKPSITEMRVLSSDEEYRFANYLMNDLDDCKFGILLAAMTGLRIGEICALKWEDLSFSEGVLKVAKTMQRLQTLSEGSETKTAVYIGPPKSQTSIREIPLSRDCIALCERIGRKRPDSYILTGTEKYIEPRTLQYRIKKYTQACGLSGVHFHTLRHTFATKAVEVGFEIKSLSEVLGHSSTTVTLNRYVHPSLQTKRRNMDKIPSLIS